MFLDEGNGAGKQITELPFGYTSAWLPHQLRSVGCRIPGPRLDQWLIKLFGYATDSLGSGPVP
ncbi:hypothetical protein Plhal304r1_c029g0096581 [Plasmopara halstedii]